MTNSSLCFELKNLMSSISGQSFIHRGALFLVNLLASLLSISVLIFLGMGVSMSVLDFFALGRFLFRFSLMSSESLQEATC